MLQEGRKELLDLLLNWVDQQRLVHEQELATIQKFAEVSRNLSVVSTFAQPAIAYLTGLAYQCHSCGVPTLSNMHLLWWFVIL